jgi:hypothetical protein
VVDLGEDMVKKIRELNLGYEPRIVVGVSTQDKMLTIFAVQLMRIRMLYGEIVEDLLLNFDKPVNVSRNTIMSEFLINYPYATHLLLLDDDVIVPDDFIVSLLRAQKETGFHISSGLLVKKSPPHLPLMLKKVSANAYVPITSWTDRYVVADAMGFGCVLIFRRVLQDLPYPFCVSDVQSEDYYFFDKCSMFGYSTVVDTELVCGHVGYNVFTIEDMKRYMSQIRAQGVQKMDIK